MSVEAVRAYLDQFGLAEKILEFEQSSATVELAAEAVGTEPARIAKTMAFAMPEDHPTPAVLVVCAGDAKVWSSAFKRAFHTKPRFVAPDALVEMVGHPMGGVCPFALAEGVEVYLDESLRRFDVVYPAAGSEASAVRLTLQELEESSRARGWVDVCKDWVHPEAE